MEFVRLSRADGSFDQLWASWDRACDAHRENFEDFAPSALSVLQSLASEPQTSHAGVFALRSTPDEFKAVCQLNSAFLPGYTGKVLRLRHLVLNPHFEFSSEDQTDEYIAVLTEVFTGVVEVAETHMPSQHIKLHLRSPADRQFFTHFQEALRRSEVFASVQLVGSWLYLTRDR